MAFDSVLGGRSASERFIAKWTVRKLSVHAVGMLIDSGYYV